MSSKALRQMYKEHHICIHCGQNDAMPGRVSCAECLAKDLERHTKAYENLSGETKAAYLQKRNERQREKRKRLVAKGICTTCLKRPMSKGYRSCIECRTRMLKRERETVRNTEKHLALVPIATNRQFPASVAVRSTMQAALLPSQNADNQRASGYHKSNRKSA